MEQEGLVQNVSIDHFGETFSSSYFVENGMIHASIGGRVLISPLGNCPAADTVRALLTGHLLQNSRKISNGRIRSEGEL